jgi:hypothetical protein
MALTTNLIGKAVLTMPTAFAGRWRDTVELDPSWRQGGRVCWRALGACWRPQEEQDAEAAVALRHAQIAGAAAAAVDAERALAAEAAGLGEEQPIRWIRARYSPARWG